MRLITLRLTTVLATVAVAGLALVHGQTPPVQQTPPAQQTAPMQPPTVIGPAAAVVPPIPPCPSLPPGLSDVGPMLDHIVSVVDQALGSVSASMTAAQVATTGTAPGSMTSTGMMGTSAQPAPITVSGGTTNKVSIDRDKLDEIRVEVEQIKAILKK